MKNSFWKIVFLFLLLFPAFTYGQNLPSFSLPEKDSLFKFQNSQQIIVAEISDADSGSNSNITVSVSSEDESLVAVQSVSYQPGEKIATVILNVKGIVGTVKLNISVTDEDGSIEQSYEVKVVDYDRKGWTMSLYDIEFWKYEKPDESTLSVFDSIIGNSEIPYNDLDWDNIPLTVGLIAGQEKQDFFTSTITGYITPPVTGEYQFHLSSHEPSFLYISDDQNVQRNTVLLQDDWQTDDPVSEAITLEEGKIYGIYGVNNQIVGGPRFEIYWSGPSLSKQLITNDYSYYIWDHELPSAPDGLVVDIIETQRAFISWNSSMDNKKVTGYKVYVNGELKADGIKDTQHILSGLEPDTHYSVVVSAYDEMGNESLVSELLSFNTYPEDLFPPSPPTQINLDYASGISMKFSWSGAVDMETTVVGYYLLLADTLYQEERINNTVFQLSGLTPELTYDVSIIAEDAGGNKSVSSESFQFQTSLFNPTDTTLGDNLGRLRLLPEVIAKNTGIGINGPFQEGDMINNPEVRQLALDLKPSLIRWGTIDANKLSFEGSTGTGKVNTYAKMIELTAEANAAFALTIGVDSDVDYITADSVSFTRLMEYLAGPSSTEGGGIRAAEGYEEPLLDMLPQILIEFGNEVWGEDVHFAPIGSNYFEYGAWCREMANVIKASPYYDANKIKLVYSGRKPLPGESFELNQRVMKGDNGEVEVLGVSGYLGGDFRNDAGVEFGETVLQYYRFRYLQFSDYLHGMPDTMYDDMYANDTNVKPFYFYEGNASTSDYNGRLGQALLMVDYLASGMRLGSIYPTLYHLTHGEWRITNPDNSYSPRPAYNAIELFNTTTLGDILNTDLETANELIDGNNRPIKLDPVGHHFYKNKDGKYVLVLISRDFESDYAVEVIIPDEIYEGPAQSTVYDLTSKDFNSTTSSTLEYSLELTNETLITVPAHTMKIIVFEGKDFEYTPYEVGDFKYLRSNADIKLIGSQLRDSIHLDAGLLNVFVTGRGEDFYHDENFQWKIENDSVDVEVTQNGRGFKVRASGNCAGNGSIKIITWAEVDGVTVASDSMNVRILNQGSNCDETILGVSQPMKSLIAYPNPVTDKLHIELDSNLKHELNIFDFYGRLVDRRIINNDFDADFSKFKKGIYFVRVKSENSYYAIKVIKE